MRLDVQRQFHHIKQGYSSRSMTVSVSSTYSPGMRSRLTHPTKATTDSPYSITGLPPDMQVIFCWFWIHVIVKVLYMDTPEQIPVYNTDTFTFIYELFCMVLLKC